MICMGYILLNQGFGGYSMSFRFKKNLISFILTQLAIIIISLIYHREISLVHYINISFFATSALLLSALLVYTIHSGFYDTIFRSFNLAFSRGKDKRRFEDIPKLSEMISFKEKPLFYHGIINGLLMGLALLIYYV